MDGSSGQLVGELTAAAGGDRLLATQLQLARIDGMLSTVLQGHEQRFLQLEKDRDMHEQRLNDKGKLLARVDERLSDLEEDGTRPPALLERVQALEGDRSGRYGRNMAMLALLAGLPGTCLAVMNFIRLSNGG